MPEYCRCTAERAALTAAHSVARRADLLKKRIAYGLFPRCEDDCQCEDLMVKTTRRSCSVLRLSPVAAMALEPLHVVYLLVVLYASCYQLQSPLEPFLVETLAKDADGAAAYAQLQSFFQVLQMFGSFAVGYCLDVVGLRIMFVLNFVGCAASYALLAQAASIQMLYLSKVPSVLMAGFLCAQTAAAKLTPAGADRATALGRLTSSYTIGGVIGPALGGVLGVQVAARLAVVGSLVAVCLVALLPSSMDERAHEEDKSLGAKETATGAQYVPFRTRVHTLLMLTWPLVMSKFASGLVNSSMGAARPLLLKNDFEFDAARLGVFMSASFFGSALVGLQLGAITEALGGNGRTVVRCLGSMATGYLLMGTLFAPWAGAMGRRTPDSGVWLYAALSLCLALFQFPLATTVTALTTGSVPATLKGTQVGLEHAIFAFAALLGPNIGVFVLRMGGLAGCALAAGTAYLLLYTAWRARGAAWTVAAEQRGATKLLRPPRAPSQFDGVSGASKGIARGRRAPTPQQRSRSPSRTARK